MKDSVKSWEDWIGVQKAAVQLMLRNNLADAAEVIEEYLKREINQQMRIEALAFLGSVREEQGDLKRAVESTLEAHALTQVANYTKYTIELTLGSLFKMLHALEEATAWYQRALETVVQDPSTSGAAALKSYLQLKADSELSTSERELCVKVVRQAWSLFGLSTAPDLTDLPKAAEVLIDAGSRPLSG